MMGHVFRTQRSQRVLRVTIESLNVVEQEVWYYPTIAGAVS